MGLKAAGPIEAKELWSGVRSHVTNPMSIKLNPSDAAIYQFSN
jgi:hypothetical protein